MSYPQKKVNLRRTAAEAAAEAANRFQRVTAMAPWILRANPHLALLGCLPPLDDAQVEHLDNLLAYACGGTRGRRPCRRDCPRRPVPQPRTRPSQSVQSRRTDRVPDRHPRRAPGAGRPRRPGPTRCRGGARLPHPAPHSPLPELWPRPANRGVPMTTASVEESEVLIRCARSFDRAPKEEPPHVRKARAGLPPGSDYNIRGPDWPEILEGWTVARENGEVRYWRRPGKDAPGWSSDYEAFVATRLVRNSSSSSAATAARSRRRSLTPSSPALPCCNTPATSRPRRRHWPRRGTATTSAAGPARRPPRTAARFRSTSAP